MKRAGSLMLVVLAPSSGEPDMVSLKVSNTDNILFQITAYSFFVRFSVKNVSLVESLINIEKVAGKLFTRA